MTKRKWIRHRTRSRRYKIRTYLQRHKTNRKLKRNFSSPVLKVSKPTRGTILRELKEDIESNLAVPDISHERKRELITKLDSINKSLKNPLFRKNLSSYEIVRAIRTPGRKTQLLQLREGIEENLEVPDISNERRRELKERLDSINQQIKRTQSNPPYLPATGRIPSEMKLSLLERYKGTSAKRPEFLETLNLPLDEDLPQIRAEQQRRASEQYGVKKALDIIEDKALAEAMERQRHTGTKILLKDLKKYKRTLSSFPRNRVYAT